MTRRARPAARALAGATAVAVLAVALAACAGGAPSGSTPSGSPSDGPSSAAPSPDAPLPSPTRGLPEGATPAEGLPGAVAGVGWSADPGRLDVVTFGSSSCPRTGKSPAAWDDAHEAVVVEIAEPDPDAICTMDLGPTTSVVAVPGDVDETAPLTVRLADDGEVEVAPRDQAGKAGPVAWLEQ